MRKNASVTMTANRIEWNAMGGIVIYGGEKYNITGNYIDRSGRAAISLLPKGDQINSTFSITGNVMYRSGAHQTGGILKSMKAPICGSKCTGISLHRQYNGGWPR